MKVRVMCLVLCVFVFASIFCGCGNNGNTEIIGKWVPTTAKTDGETISYSELGIDEDQFGLDFKDSSNCTVTLAGISCDSAYTFNGTSVDLTVNGTAYKLSYDSGVLTMVLNYDNNRIEFSFTKQR